MKKNIGFFEGLRFSHELSDLKREISALSEKARKLKKEIQKLHIEEAECLINIQKLNKA